MPLDNVQENIQFTPIGSIPEPEIEDLCEHCHQPTDECHCYLHNCGHQEDGRYCDNCNLCSHCCECYTCENCGNRVSSVCSDCCCCDECCACTYCEVCGRPYDLDDFCENCECCPNCCECGDCETEENRSTSVTSVSDKYLPIDLIFYESNPKDKLLKVNPRFISAEIEINNYAHQYSQKLVELVKLRNHATKSDGSLSSFGVEICTAPANGKLYIERINEICTFLEKINPEVSSNCGLHIHVDVRDFGWIEMWNFVNLWQLVENSLFQKFCPSRLNNHYCNSIKGIPNICDVPFKNFKEYFYKNFYNFNCDSTNKTYVNEYLRKIKYKDNQFRYHAINFHAWHYLGTLENRMHYGTVDANEIIHWSTTFANIVHCASLMSYQECLIVNEIINQPYFFILKKVFIDKIVTYFENNTNPTQLIKILKEI